MALHDFRCPKCEREIKDVLLPPGVIESYEPQCFVCKIVMEQTFKSSSGHRGFEPYVDKNLGPEPVLVTGRGHRRELMRKAGLEFSSIRGDGPREV